MTKRVSADTITEITADPGFSPPGKTPSLSQPPSAEELEAAIRQKLADQLARARRELERDGTPDDKPSRARKSFARAEAQQRAFETIIKDVPEGFRLVPVLYSKITQEENAKVHHEYLKQVRSRFLRFLAEKHADELRALGIGPLGVERMKKGLDPADENGRLYEVNVDHILERAGSGLWAQSSEKDPDQEPEVAPKFRQNHFGNLILLPEHIHEYKNILNNLQNIGDLAPGESKWILMMVPERKPGQPGFVCPPQPQGSRWEGLRLRADDPFRKISHAAFTVDQASDKYNEFLARPAVGGMVKSLHAVAQAQRRTVSECANDNQPGKRSLGAIFNDLLEYDAAARQHADTLLKPALEEASAYVSRLFDEVAAKSMESKGKNLVKNFAEFYRSKDTQRLRENVGKLPFEEARALRRTFDRIDRELDALEQQVGEKFQSGKKARNDFNGNAPRASNSNAPRASNGNAPRAPKGDAPRPDKGRGKAKKRDGRGRPTDPAQERDWYWAQKRKKKRNGSRPRRHGFGS